MDFHSQLKDRLEIYLGKDLHEVKEELIHNSSPDVIDTYKALEAFRSAYPSLSREMIEKAVGINQGKIADAISNYKKNHQKLWRK